MEGLNEVKANKVDVVMVADLATLMAEQAEQLDGRLAEYQKDNAQVGTALAGRQQDGAEVGSPSHAAYASDWPALWSENFQKFSNQLWTVSI